MIWGWEGGGLVRTPASPGLALGPVSWGIATSP